MEDGGHNIYKKKDGFFFKLNHETTFNHPRSHFHGGCRHMVFCFLQAIENAHLEPDGQVSTEDQDLGVLIVSLQGNA